MVQIATRFTGVIAPCQGCGGQPLHIHVRGRETDFLECPRCGTRTPPFKSVQEAVSAWDAQETHAIGVK
jgi:hypothetical protein